MDNEGKNVWFLGLAVIVIVAFGMWVFSPTEVTVTGVGKVSVPATEATFNVTLAASNDVAGDALAGLRSKVEVVKGKLSEAGINADNVSETQVTLTPSAAIVANAKGYQALTTLTVKTKNVPVAADLVVEMYKNGATVVSQPVVAVDQLEKLEKAALKEALDKAKTSLSDTVGMRPVRKIISIQQASSGNVATTTKEVADNKGEFEVSKAVSVTYRVW